MYFWNLHVHIGVGIILEGDFLCRPFPVIDDGGLADY